jgi:transcriptional regulator GlxA family with amidase domain
LFERLRDQTPALMNRRTFTRRFRLATGTTVGLWLLNQRLALAQRMLKMTDKPIELIAETAGFASPSLFRRSFGQAFGVKPSVYRREFRREFRGEFRGE